MGEAELEMEQCQRSTGEALRARLTITGESSQLGRARDWLVGAMRNLPGISVSDEQIFEVQLALQEALTNVMAHALRPDGAREIDIVMFRDGRLLELELTYEGADFDDAVVPAPCFDGSRNDGFGLFIMRNLMDDLEHGQRSPGHCYIRMRKNLRGRGATSMIQVQQAEHTLVVEVAHTVFDAHTSKEFRGEMENKLKDRQQVVLDMSRVTFIDSTGLGALISCLRQVNAGGGDLKLCGLTANVRSLFQMVRMHRLFEIYNTRDEAVRAFAKPEER